MHAKYLSSTCFCCACSCRFFFRFIFCMCLSEKSFHKTRIRPMKIVFWYIKRAHQNDRYITFLSVNKDEAKEKTKQTNERRNEYLLRNFCDIQTAILLGSIFFFLVSIVVQRPIDSIFITSEIFICHLTFLGLDASQKPHSAPIILLRNEYFCFQKWKKELQPNM